MYIFYLVLCCVRTDVEKDAIQDRYGSHRLHLFPAIHIFPDLYGYKKSFQQLENDTMKILEFKIFADKAFFEDQNMALKILLEVDKKNDNLENSYIIKGRTPIGSVRITGFQLRYRMVVKADQIEGIKERFSHVKNDFDVFFHNCPWVYSRVKSISNLILAWPVEYRWAACREICRVCRFLS